MRTLTAMAAWVLMANGASRARAFEPAPAPADEPEAQGTIRMSASASTDAPTAAVEVTADGDAAGSVPGYGGFAPGFETGLRLGVGASMGKAGDAATGGGVDLNDLAPLRVPVWIDVGYRLSERTTFGLYGQIGFGNTGDACIGDCDWSDLRAGVQAQWRLTEVDAAVKPWLGVGLGWESLSFRSLLVVPVTMPNGDSSEVAIRAAQKLGGPELTLQLGLDFRVEDALDVGPYVSATLGQYMVDSLNCASAQCAGNQFIDASGLHSWLGVGLRGNYLP